MILHVFECVQQDMFNLLLIWMNILFCDVIYLPYVEKDLKFYNNLLISIDNST